MMARTPASGIQLNCHANNNSGGPQPASTASCDGASPDDLSSVCAAPMPITPGSVQPRTVHGRSLRARRDEHRARRDVERAARLRTLCTLRAAREASRRRTAVFQRDLPYDTQRARGLRAAGIESRDQRASAEILVA